MSPDRTNQFKMLLSDGELEMVRALAERRGLSAADYIRTLIRAEHEAVTALEKRKLPTTQAPSFTASFAAEAAKAGFALGQRHRAEADARKKTK